MHPLKVLYKDFFNEWEEKAGGEIVLVEFLYSVADEDEFPNMELARERIGSFVENKNTSKQKNQFVDDINMDIIVATSTKDRQTDNIQDLAYLLTGTTTTTNTMMNDDQVDMYTLLRMLPCSVIQQFSEIVGCKANVNVHNLIKLLQSHTVEGVISAINRLDDVHLTSLYHLYLEKKQAKMLDEQNIQHELQILETNETQTAFEMSMISYFHSKNNTTSINIFAKILKALPEAKKFAKVTLMKIRNDDNDVDDVDEIASSLQRWCLSPDHHHPSCEEIMNKDYLYNILNTFALWNITIAILCCMSLKFWKKECLSWVFDNIIRIINAHIENNHVRLLLNACGNGMDEMVENDDVKARKLVQCLVQMLIVHETNKHTSLKILWIMTNIAEKHDNIVTSLSTNTVMRVMYQLYEENSDVVIEGLRLVERMINVLQKSTREKDKVMLNDLFELVKVMVDKHMENDDIIEEAFDVFYHVLRFYYWKQLHSMVEKTVESEKMDTFDNWWLTSSYQNNKRKLCIEVCNGVFPSPECHLAELNILQEQERTTSWWDNGL
jgi:hypothetical protein